MAVSYSPALDVSDGPAKDPSEKYFVPSSGGSSASLLVYDTFTDAGGTALTAHTPDTDNTGSGWSVQASAPSTDFRIAPLGTFLDIGASLTEVCWITNSESSYIFEHVPASSPTTFCILRYIDADNHWRINCNSGSPGTLFIVERSGGTNTTRASVVGAGLGASSFWVADDGSTISVGKDRGAAGASYSSTLHNSSQNFGFTGNAGTNDIDTLLAYVGTTDPADLVDP